MRLKTSAAAIASRLLDGFLVEDDRSRSARVGRERCRHRSVTDGLVELERELAGLRASAGGVPDAIDRGNFASGYASLETALGALARSAAEHGERVDRLAEGRERFDRALDALYAAILRQRFTAFPRAARQLAHLARIGTIVAEVFDSKRSDADGRPGPSAAASEGPFAPGTPSGERLRACIEEIRAARHALLSGADGAPGFSNAPARPAQGAAR